jgi:hypothetical protein
MPIRLNGPQSGQLNEVLREAFNPNTFDRMLLYRLDRQTYNIARVGADFQTTLFDVIEAANMQGWVEDLIARAREANPGNAKLLAFSQQFGLASTDKPRQELERVIVQTNSYLNVTQWREKLGEIETRVCRIEIETDQGKMIYGTGFLFGGPNVVLTNYHVMEPVLAGRNNTTTPDGYSAKASNVICRFDYKRLQDGKTLNSGTEYFLADDWYLDDSPNYPLDQEPVPADCLDYALFRLKTPAGAEAVGLKPEPGAVVRGFIPFPAAANPYTFASNSPLFIMQHPRQKPLALAFDTDSVIGLNANGTRVRYRTNTDQGSSGAPCFSQNWELVALHHSGDPDFDPDHKPAYNEGIPISKIVSLMQDDVIKKLAPQEL